jgi:hypothetical protein
MPQGCTRALAMTPALLASHTMHFNRDRFRRHFLLRNSLCYLRGLYPPLRLRFHLIQTPQPHRKLTSWRRSRFF